MSDYEPNPSPTPTVQMLGRAACSETRVGWLWHCPEHEVHGSALDAGEAEFMAGSHTYYMRTDPYDAEGQGCATYFWEVSTSDA